MHSYTSSSDSHPDIAGGGQRRNGHLGTTTLVLLAGCFALALGLEFVSRYGFDRISRIQQTLISELQSATSLRGNRTVLVAGNSLLEAAVDFPAFAGRLQPRWVAKRVVVSDTNYFDWYYGLRRLFESGSRPGTVVLVLTSRQLVSNGIRGGYFASYLMNGADIPRVQQDLGLHPTEASALFFEWASKFYGVRAEIRKWILELAMPDFESLAHLLTRMPPVALSDHTVKDIGEKRLSALRDLVASRGGKLILVVPPLAQPGDNSVALQEAGLKADVPVLIPLASGSLPLEDYRDGYHLNPDGARRFTARFGPLVRDALVALEER